MSEKKKQINIDVSSYDDMVTFTKDIEELRKSSDTYKEAIVFYCELNECEIDEVLALIPESLKAKMYKEEVKLRNVIADDNSIELI